MKRHPGLIPLSHDHHDTLVVAQGLILGHAKAPRSDWPDSRRAQVDRVAAFFAETLEPHFDAEETCVFPAAARQLAGGAALVRRLLADHDAIRSLVTDLERDPTSDLDTRLPALGRRLEAHIRTEERELFESMQREMTPAISRPWGPSLASDLETVGTTAGAGTLVPPPGSRRRTPSILTAPGHRCQHLQVLTYLSGAVYPDLISGRCRRAPPEEGLAG